MCSSIRGQFRPPRIYLIFVVKCFLLVENLCVFLELSLVMCEKNSCVVQVASSFGSCWCRLRRREMARATEEYLCFVPALLIMREHSPVLFHDCTPWLTNSCVEWAWSAILMSRSSCSSVCLCLVQPLNAASAIQPLGVPQRLAPCLNPRHEVSPTVCSLQRIVRSTRFESNTLHHSLLVFLLFDLFWSFVPTAFII